VRLGIGSVGANALLLAALSCGREAPLTPPPPPGDTTAPVVAILYPQSDDPTRYDLDSNGLVDLRVTWSDSGGRVDPASARVTCAPQCLPGLPEDTDLAAGWRVVQRDSAGLVLEETVPLLLREGTVRLAVSVADTAGHRSSPVIVPIDLPPGDYDRTIPLGSNPPCTMDRGVSIGLSPDGGKGFVGFHGCIALFDTDGDPRVRYLTSWPVEYGNVRVDTATGLAWFLQDGDLAVLDTRSEQLTRSGAFFMGEGWDAAFVADTLIVGADCLIWMLEKTSLQVIDTISIRDVPTGYCCTCPTVSRLAIGPDHRTGWAALLDGGIVKFDIPTRALVANYLPPLSIYQPGIARGVVIGSGGRLYLARPNEGLEEYQTDPWQLLQSVSPSPATVDIALAPDGHTLFTSTWTCVGGPCVSTPRIYDVPGLRLRYQFPPRPGKITDGLVFSSDGKRVFLMALDEVRVYLVRPA